MQFNQVIKTDKGMPYAYYCANMFPMDEGMVAGIRLFEAEKREAGTPTANLGTIIRWAQNSDGIWGVDGDRTYLEGTLDFAEVFSGGDKSIVTDIDDNIAVIDERYIHHSQKTTLASSLASSDTSMELTDASAFPGSGQVIVAGGPYIEVINYSGKSTNTLTGLTRAQRNTTASSHTAGTTVYWFDENWADLGESSYYRPSVQHENHVFVGNGHYVAGWDNNDSATFSTNKLDLPAGFTIVALSSVLMGNQKMVLIGANRQHQASLFIWDGEDTTWQREIPLAKRIECVDKNYIGVQGGVYVTDGYDVQAFAMLPGSTGITSSDSHVVQSILATSEYLYCGVKGSGLTQRDVSGLWVWSLKRKEWVFVQLASGDAQNHTIGAITSRGGGSIYVSEGNQVDRTSARNTSHGQIWVPYIPATGRHLRLTDIHLNVDTYRVLDNAYAGQVNFDIVVRVNTSLHGSDYYTSTIGSGGTFSTTQFTLPENWSTMVNVGDRIEFLGGGAAGEIRNVTAISDDTDPVITVDKAFSTAPSNSQALLVTPLVKVGEISVRDAVDLEDLHFRVPSQPVFQKLLIEVEFRCPDTTTAPRLNAIELTGVIL